MLRQRSAHRADRIRDQEHIMSDIDNQGLSEADLAAEGATALPDKEVVSILDLNADLDLAIDAAAPIDLAVAANANVAAPIDAAVGANILSEGSTAQALSDQGVIIDQSIDADAVATSEQTSDLDQSNDVVDDGASATEAGTAETDPTGLSESVGDTTGTVGDTVGDTTGDLDGATGAVGDTVGDTAAGLDTSEALSGDLLNVDVNLAADADLAAPIAGSVAANANVAAPIDAAVAANVGSVDSEATAISQQDAIITQDVSGSAEATTDQDSEIQQ
jgi:hypothetical protein